MHLDASLLETLRTILLSPVLRFFDDKTQTVWTSYFGAMLVAMAFYFWRRRHRKSSLKGLARYLFPKSITHHPSTLLDLKMYVFSSFYLAAQAVIVFGGMAGLSTWLLHAAELVIGPGAQTSPLPLWALVVVPVLLYLALELGYWLSHFWLHHVPWLWEFHKVHHSAEVMTPMTEWRQHPVEYFFVPLVMGVVSSAALAIAQWFFGRDLLLSGLWTPAVILLVFIMTYLHLRHSHVNLAVTGLWGHILQSPAHHHIHHSTDPRHFDKNLGFCLSIWDTAFGTLYMPRKDEVLTLGLVDEDGMKDELVSSTSLWRHMALPFQRVFSQGAAATTVTSNTPPHTLPSGERAS